MYNNILFNKNKNRKAFKINFAKPFGFDIVDPQALLEYVLGGKVDADKLVA